VIDADPNAFTGEDTFAVSGIPFALTLATHLRKPCGVVAREMSF
jgi:hypothetical protein